MNAPRWRSLSALALLLALASPAHAARQPVFQDGVILPNHLVKQTTGGLIKDVGTVTAGDAQGKGVSPFAVNDALTERGLCSDSADPTVAGTYICLGHTAAGLPVIAVGTIGAGASQGLSLLINNSLTSWPPTGVGLGNVVGPNTTISGNIASWNNGTGTLAKDSGIAAGGGVLNLTQSAAAQTLLDSPGSATDPAQPYFSTRPALRWELVLGSTSTPIVAGGPALRVLMTQSLSATTIINDCDGQPAETACISAILGVNQGLALGHGSTIGVTGVGTNRGTFGYGTNDTMGVQGVGEIMGAGVGIGFGGYLQGQRDNSSAAAIGVEPTTYNNTEVDCTISYTGISQCDAIWATSRGLIGGGQHLVSSGLHVGLGDGAGGLFSWFTEGVTLNQGSVKNISWNDNSSSITAFNLAGAHTNALTSLATSGFWGFGTTTPAARAHIAGNLSSSAWQSNGIGLRVASATYTDTSSSGTIAAEHINAFLTPTLAASAATTVTTAATVFIQACPTAGSNITITGCYGFVNSGASWLASGALVTGAGITLGPITAPASPAAGQMALYVDTADSKLKAKASTGTVTVLALP